MAPSSLDRIFQQASSSSPKSNGQPASHSIEDDPVVKELPGGYKKLASGVVLDKDGKPCRQCTSSMAWMSMMRSTKPASALATATAAPTTISSASSPTDCPPDVEDLGRSTWTMLHAMAASYPESASTSMQSTMKQFILTFSQLYPCGWCATDFRDWIKEPGNEPKVQSQDAFGQWMCEAHNAVNVKLGKKEFDCSLWKQRWKDGWNDGRCD